MVSVPCLGKCGLRSTTTFASETSSVKVLSHGTDLALTYKTAYVRRRGCRPHGSQSCKASLRSLRMPSLTRVGGGIYWAIGLSFAAWALREGHEYLSRLRNDREDKTQLGRWHAPMSAALVKLLVAMKPMPFVIIDVRDKNNADIAPFPQELGHIVHLPGHKANALQSRAMWSLYTPDAQTEYPSLEHLLIFIGSNDRQMLEAAKHAAKAGFQRVATLSGGAASLSTSPIQEQVPTINRDAVAAVLRQVDAGPVQQAVVIDVRRHDELSLYGSIPEWESCYDVPRPRFDDWIIMHSRVNKRAMWAAQLAKDAGFKHCLVYDKGVNGWHLHPEVKAYSHYDMGDPPHEPEAIHLETVDLFVAHTELVRLGMAHL